MKSRRDVRDHERLPQRSELHLTWAPITIVTRSPTRKGPPRRLDEEAGIRQDLQDLTLLRLQVPLTA